MHKFNFKFIFWFCILAIAISFLVIFLFLGSFFVPYKNAPFLTIDEANAFMYTLNYENHLSFNPFFRGSSARVGGSYNCVELSKIYKWAVSSIPDFDVDIYYRDYRNGGHTWCQLPDGSVLDWSAILSDVYVPEVLYEDGKCIS